MALGDVLNSAEPRRFWTYFVTAPSGLVKIGWSSNLYRRLAEIGRWSPVDLRLIAAACEGIRDMERKSTIEVDAHKVFRSKRRHGEWFEITPDDICGFLSTYNRLGVRSYLVHGVCSPLGDFSRIETHSRAAA